MSKVVKGKLFRVRRGRGKGFAGTAEAAAGPVEPALAAAEPAAGAAGAGRPARAAVMLALAWRIQEAIDRGEVKDRAEVARRLGVTRARVSQLLGLTLLAPAVQEEILTSPVEMTERTLRQMPRSR